VSKRGRYDGPHTPQKCLTFADTHDAITRIEAIAYDGRANRVEKRISDFARVTAE